MSGRERPASISLGRHAPWVVGVLVFLLYLATACPTVYFGDSGELIAAADSLGVAHPPGYPIYTLLGRVALLLPFGEPAWRMNLLSAALGAIACALVARLVQRWTESAIAAVGSGLGLAVAYDVWVVSTVAEVYTLHLFLIASLLLLADRMHDAEERGDLRRLLLMAAVVLGLGLSHRPTIVLALPAAAVLAIGLSRPRLPFRRAGPAAWAVATLIAAVVPLAAYAALLIRAGADPVANWGRPDDLAALVAHVTTRSYRFYVLGAAGWLRPEGWARAGAMLWSGFGYVGLPLALLGLVGALSGRLPSQRRPGVAVALVGGAWLLFGLSYGTEDVEVLYLPVFLAAALAAGLGLAAIRAVGGSHRSGALASVAIAAVLVASPTALHLGAANLARVSAGVDYGRDMLATVPEGGVLFVEGDDAFLLAYVQQVLGERTDVTIYDRNGLLFRDELAEVGSAPVAGENPLLYRVRREQEFVFGELRSAAPRAVMFMTWPGYALPPALRFEPQGLFYRVLPSYASPLDTSTLWNSYHEQSVTEQALRTKNPFALTVAATYPLMRGERLLFDGHADEAAMMFDRASALARNSETIHNYLGTIYGRLGDLGRAEREFLEAIRIKPISIRAWNNLAQARLLAGNVAGAREAWGRSLAVETAQPEVHRLLGQHAAGR
jgi:4-amino-4-deoxy-L-arabinose transferase-like glycosyltransferase/Tfp pilus assembly protein PilF